MTWEESYIARCYEEEKLKLVNVLRVKIYGKRELPRLV